MNLKSLLAERELTTALIVDDGYDEVPKADDLSTEDEAWANFFADIGDNAAFIAEVFPAYADLHASDLRRSDAFVAAVWGLREKMTASLWEGLFAKYLRDEESDRGYLQFLENALRDLGVEPIPSGRDIPEKGRMAPLIFADLFLGTTQDDHAVEESIERLRKLLKDRSAQPPLVVLMSRSTRLHDKKADFRERVQLLGAMFRVLSKQEIVDGKTLYRTLHRLARHHKDALLLAKFLHSWDVGLEAARQRFLATIRRLDLSDYGQIQQLLLDFEGQPLGSYLLDVFDRVLQHEIEADPNTITGAESLSQINAVQYPPHLAGSSDLQDFVYRSIYQNPERLRVTTTDCGAPVSFGDILVKRSALAPRPDGAQREETDDVLLVLTPACDLARSGAKRVMLMAGALEELRPNMWTYKSTPLRTPIAMLPEDRRAWIRWDLKDVQTWKPSDLAAALGTNGSHKLLARLRESQALELQQKLLADLGRVGLLAPMPATFPVTVEGFYANLQGQLQRLVLPLLERDGGVYFAGRDKDSKVVARLVFGEDACYEILDAISGLDATVVHARARETLARLQASESFARILERGLTAPAPEQTAFVELTSPSNGADGKAGKETIGLIRRDPSDDLLPANQLKHAAFVLFLRSIGVGATNAAGS